MHSSIEHCGMNIPAGHMTILLLLSNIFFFLRFLYFVEYVLYFSVIPYIAARTGRYTVEPVLKDHSIGHKYMVSQGRWSLVTGSFTLKYRTFCQKVIVLQDRWSLMAVVFQDRFHCITYCLSFTGVQCAGNGVRTLRMRPAMVFQNHHADIFLTAFEKVLTENE